jgi:hypothetical protein
VRCEVLLDANDSMRAHKILGAMAEARDCKVKPHYTGNERLLMLWGYGRPDHSAIVHKHLSQGGRAIMWDLGYFGKSEGYCRASIDHWHPQQWIDGTPADPDRLDRFDIHLQEGFKPLGRVVIAGLGDKSKRAFGLHGWEAQMLRKYPRAIIKRKRDRTPIAEVLRGSSLLVCRHSNCAIDATIAGVPFECTDGAAMWLRDRPFTRENRLDFLRRLAWWQWKAEEAEQAWTFLEARL